MVISICSSIIGSLVLTRKNTLLPSCMQRALSLLELSQLEIEHELQSKKLLISIASGRVRRMSVLKGQC